MIFLAHLGITAGVFRSTELLNQKWSGEIAGNRSLTSILDYRLILVGSVLPDLIDKPLWLFASGLGYPSGRSYAHSLAFLLILIIASLLLLRFKHQWLLILSGATAMHLLLDAIWLTPNTFLWPLFGSFSVSHTSGYVGSIFQELVTEPVDFIPEIVGLAILIFFAPKITYFTGRFVKRG